MLLDDEKRLELRAVHCKPIVDEFFEWLKSVLETGQDIRYVLRPMLGIYLAEFSAEIAAVHSVEKVVLASTLARFDPAQETAMVAGMEAKAGEPWVAAEADAAGGPSTAPRVVIPMRIKEQLIGAIVIYSLLEQKPSFSSLDFELFNLLAGHAATALFASKLYGESERKLSTIQGFLELLKR